MTERQRKVMPRIECERIADKTVATQVWPDGTRQQLIMPVDQSLILADWFYQIAEDHQQSVAPEAHPSPESDPETGEAGGCTRTRSIHQRFADMLDQLDGAQVSVRTTARRGPTLVAHGGDAPLCDECRPAGICKELERAAAEAEERAGLRGPVVAIHDGEVRRA